MGHYIVDFYSHESKLAIEVDGGIQMAADQMEYDNVRTQYLETRGLRVIRFTNERVQEDVGIVLNEIRNYLTPGTSPGRRGGSINRLSLPLFV